MFIKLYNFVKSNKLYYLEKFNNLYISVNLIEL